MTSSKELLTTITTNKGMNVMRYYDAMVPSIKLGLLGLALTASPLSIRITKAEQSVPTVKSPRILDKGPVVPPSDPIPVTYPVNKKALARKPQGRQTVETIEEALAAAYQNNTEIKELQAQLRSKDEGVPQALAGWRPTVTANASVGGEKNILSGTQKDQGELGSSSSSGSNASTVSADVTLQQNLFNGGKTVAQTCQAENLVQAARAQLSDKEREILFATVQAYFNVVAKIGELAYRRSTEEAFKKTLEATEDKFKVGEETRTGVAQAQASLARSIAERELAEAQLLASEATFEQVTGARPGKLKKPGEFKMLPRTLNEAIEIAKKNNPAILAALYKEKADRNAIKINDAGLLPKVDLQGKVARTGRNSNTRVATNSQRFSDFTTAETVSVNLTVPIYEAGAIRGKTRELRETAEQSRIAIETARRKVIQQLVEAWETYLAQKANVAQYTTQVKANEVALEGTRQEMLVGSKILLDVLNAQRDLVSSQLSLIQAEQQYYQSAFAVLAAMGRLNTMDMKLQNVKHYNPEIHYKDVRNSL